MKKAILFFVLLFSISVKSQGIYPLNLNVEWDLPIASDNVTQFNVILNGATTIYPATICSTVSCRAPIIVGSAAVQTVSVTATNQWGTSAPSTLLFTASAPGNSKNIRIRFP